MTRQILRRIALCGAVLVVAAAAVSASAEATEEEVSETGVETQVPTVEELIVTAQRVAESIQDVPIAVTALTDDMLADRQIINPSDLQLNAPNVSFSATNFGGSNLSIRGIGQLVISRSGESGVSSHVNEIAVATNLNSVEFFDLERIEILRGPQGTLFGRNATGGALNVVTKMPVFESFDGFADAEAGSFSHSRFKGAINLPLASNIALRVSGFKLERDGYIENLAYGQTNSAGQTIPGIDEDIDGRNLWATRATLAWNISDRASVWVQYSAFREDDDRVRITNQVCKRNPLPTTGCLPNEFGWDTPHLGATTGGIFGGAAGALPAGVDGSDPALYDYPRPAISSFRKMHTDFEPIFEQKEDLWSFGFNYDFDNLSVSLGGAVRDYDGLSRQDYLMDVGPRMVPTPQNPAGIWPTSEPAGGAGAEWLSDTCNVAEGTSGLFGGCVLPTHQNRSFAYDQGDTNGQYHTVEAKARSDFDGRFNFLLGTSRHEGTNYGGYYVLANTLDLVSLYGSPALGAPPLYPGFFYNTNNPEDGGAPQDGQAAFGELYYDATDRLKFTAGLRFNEDNKQVSDSSVLFNSADVSAAVGGLFGPSPIWLRSGLFGEMAAMAANPAASLSESSSRILEFHNAGGVYATNAPAAIGSLVALGAAQAIGAQIAAGLLPIQFVPQVIAGLPLPPIFQATVGALLSQDPAIIAQDGGIAAGAQAFVAIADAVGPVPAFGETRFVTGSPSEAQWREVSGRVGLDYQLGDNTLLYGFFSRGYKPGGFNPAIPPAFQATSAFTFDAEQVNAFEVGAKTALLDGGFILRGAAFTYDYSGLQVTRIRNNSSINENVDAGISGLELEGQWRPVAMPGLLVDFAYSTLLAKVTDTMSVDPINRTGGNPEYVLLNNIDPGSLTGINFVARESQITPPLIAAFVASLPPATQAVISGDTGANILYPTNSAGVSIPAYFSRSFLDAVGVETLDGIPVNLDGNDLPNAPQHTARLGLAHTWEMGSGLLTLRWDYYWQSKSYAREFNAVGDEIDSWSQHNVMLVYESGGGWSARAWVRNVLDDENVTGKYLTSDTSGFYRNYFLTEPQIFGVSLRYAFGE